MGTIGLGSDSRTQEWLMQETQWWWAFIGDLWVDLALAVISTKLLARQCWGKEVSEG